MFYYVIIYLCILLPDFNRYVHVIFKKQSLYEVIVQVNKQRHNSLLSYMFLFVPLFTNGLNDIYDVYMEPQKQLCQFRHEFLCIFVIYIMQHFFVCLYSLQINCRFIQQLHQINCSQPWFIVTKCSLSHLQSVLLKLQHF